MGVDTTAYLNQAGQYAKGQRVYKDLNTNQGRCYYPAGHLKFYQPFYWMYISNENAEYFMKAFHMIVYSVANLIVGSMAYDYFSGYDKNLLGSLRAQTVCFVILAN